MTTFIGKEWDTLMESYLKELQLFKMHKSIPDREKKLKSHLEMFNKEILIKKGQKFRRDKNAFQSDKAYKWNLNKYTNNKSTKHIQQVSAPQSSILFYSPTDGTQTTQKCFKHQTPILWWFDTTSNSEKNLVWTLFIISLTLPLQRLGVTLPLSWYKVMYHHSEGYFFTYNTSSLNVSFPNQPSWALINPSFLDLILTKNRFLHPNPDTATSIAPENPL